MSCLRLALWPGIQAKIYLYSGIHSDNIVKLDEFKNGTFDNKTIGEIKEKGTFTIISSMYNATRMVNEIKIRNNKTGIEETGDLSNNDRYKVWTYYPNSNKGVYYRVFEDCPASLAGGPAYPAYGSTPQPPVGRYPSYGHTVPPPAGLKLAYPVKNQPTSGKAGNPVLNAYIVASAVQGVGATAPAAAAGVKGVVDCVGGLGGPGCVDLSVDCSGCDGGGGGCDGTCFLGGRRNKTRKNKKSRRRNKKSRKMRRKA
jgi:hypothetical protein